MVTGQACKRWDDKLLLLSALCKVSIIYDSLPTFAVLSYEFLMFADASWPAHGMFFGHLSLCLRFLSLASSFRRSMAIMHVA